ncbi:Protein of unknown function [Austwickia chelonae]|uniref:DUF2891 domain-containing protein n=1 Tax=Austwickia chelonae NBRC 105200 TaxID=1184607 RepID=K6WAL5_9MICO|nr:DUF2891 family protein [Austwickia chelonae]GAB78882.1 hypothetical protein AUCHE_17_00940 [Austwickia chelonae NBRC 105200]SEV85837.1 Protein of unknown function [Austwickia chelonae]
MTTDLLRAQAAAWASIACDVLDTPFPYAAAHMARDRQDCDVTPWRVHPAFHGSLDWHSSAHMQWSLVTLLSVAPECLDERLTDRVVSLLDGRLTGPGLAAEADYLLDRPSFERPYGWAWAAMLCEALSRCPRPEAAGWSAAAQPLAAAVSRLVPAWLDRQVFPVRHGVHSNTAFALSLLHRAYTGLGEEDTAAVVARGIRRWYGVDDELDTRFEPSGQDFLSPALSEAECLMRVLPEAQRPDRLARLLPGLGAGRHSHLWEVPPVVDGTDGHLAHLYGLALSRAWQLRVLSSWLPGEESGRVREGARRQVEAVLPVITGGHFMATHWLVSFALLGEVADDRG